MNRSADPVLVTGAAGFVGANLVRRLLEQGAQVHLFLRPETSTWRLDEVLSALSVHPVDLTNAAAVSDAVAAIRPRTIYHLAAYGGYSVQQELGRILAVNLEGTIRLIEACAREGFDAFVQAGSSSEYGAKPQPMREEDRLDPNSPYAIAKAAATHYGRHVAVTRSLPIVTLRLFSVYGPWEDPSRFIPTLITHLLEGTLPPLVSPTTARDFVYVDDVVEAFLRAAGRTDCSGEVFNVGTGAQRTIREVVETACALHPVPATPQWGTMPPRRWDTSTWVADPSKAERRLHWTPAYDLRAGLARTLAWFQQHRAFYANAHATHS